MKKEYTRFQIFISKCLKIHFFGDVNFEAIFVEASCESISTKRNKAFVLLIVMNEISSLHMIMSASLWLSPFVLSNEISFFKTSWSICVSASLIILSAYAL